MSDQSNLLLDIGNTSIKYAWYSFPHPIADLQILRTSIESLAGLLEQASACWVCSVVSNDTNQQIEDLCTNANVPFHHAHTKALQFGITNAYTKPQNMGCDRWMAMLAGGALCDKGLSSNFIVIDAGTAITCDFIVAGKHLGGWIAPGLAMARAAVVSQTKRVFDEPQVLYELLLGCDTPQCVSYGALAQLSGMLLQASALMQSHCSKYDIYISGGDAPLLINVLSNSKNHNASANINYIENLVLIGLAKIAHEQIALK